MTRATRSLTLNPLVEGPDRGGWAELVALRPWLTGRVVDVLVCLRLDEVVLPGEFDVGVGVVAATFPREDHLATLDACPELGAVLVVDEVRITSGPTPADRQPAHADPNPGHTCLERDTRLR